eukprot:TRINITY_DN9389_c0_g1_i4.p1 TRINITY_DN9389_c0_g1~~TRINITY_DN9389_c0_g1_i4.p1  ORF type:complete len:388 (-),score=64.09 TRINITY_DN9389_c0_g1_i4:172-1335(-)
MATSPRCNGVTIRALPRSESQQRGCGPLAGAVVLDTGLGTAWSAHGPSEECKPASQTDAALEELRQGLAVESEQRTTGLRRLELSLEQLRSERRAQAQEAMLALPSIQAGAGWWDMASNKLASLDDRLAMLDEQVRQLTSAHYEQVRELRFAHNALLNQVGESDSSRSNTPVRLSLVETKVGDLQAEFDRASSERMVLRLAEEELKSHTSRLQGWLGRLEQKIDGLHVHLKASHEAERRHADRAGSEERRRKETEQMMLSLLGDLKGLSREFSPRNDSARVDVSALSSSTSVHASPAPCMTDTGWGWPAEPRLSGRRLSGALPYQLQGSQQSQLPAGDLAAEPWTWSASLRPAPAPGGHTVLGGFRSMSNTGDMADAAYFLSPRHTR